MLRKSSVSLVFTHYFAFTALILGVKFMVIASCGMTTPYWDQWDVEIDRLYRPWTDGTFQWLSLIAPHNEHRVFTGRLLALLLFVFRGNVLDIFLQIVVNAVLHASILLLYLHGLLDMLGDKSNRLLLTLFAGLIFAMPLGVENLLMNNSALYFLILFSIIFLRTVSANNDQQGLGWSIAVLVSGLLACLSFASGALTLAAGIALLGIQWITGVRRTRTALVMMLALLIMMLFSVHFTPTLPGHSHHKSQSVIDFVISIVRMTGGLMFYVPSVVFMLRQIRRKPQSGDSSWFLFAVFLWMFGQMVIIAYGRGHSNVLTSRYLDLYTIGFVANLAALFINMLDHSISWSSKPLKVWLLLLFTGFGIFLPQIVHNLDKTKSDGIEYEQQIKHYLATHDSRLLDEPGAVIPYPDPARLKMLLDERLVQSMLPENLTSVDAEASHDSQESSRKTLFLFGSILAGLSVGLFGTLLLSRVEHSR